MYIFINLHDHTAWHTCVCGSGAVGANDGCRCGLEEAGGRFGAGGLDGGSGRVDPSVPSVLSGSSSSPIAKGLLA